MNCTWRRAVCTSSFVCSHTELPFRQCTDYCGCRRGSMERPRSEFAVRTWGVFCCPMTCTSRKTKSVMKLPYHKNISILENPFYNQVGQVQHDFKNNKLHVAGKSYFDFMHRTFLFVRWDIIFVYFCDNYRYIYLLFHMQHNIVHLFHS